MFVGQNPGSDENKTARPFTGPSGNLLRRELKILGLDLDDFYATNAVHCFPPRGRGPSKGEVSACAATWGSRELTDVDPDIIVPMGDAAYRVFMPERDNPSSITQVQGSVFKRTIAGRERFVIPMVNPAFVLNNETAYLPMMQRALANMRDVYVHGEVQTAGVLPFRNTEASWSELLHIANNAEAYGFDLETTGLHRSSQIIGIGMCAEPGNGCYYPFDDLAEVYPRLAELRASLENNTQNKIITNRKYEREVLWNGGTELLTVPDAEPYRIMLGRSECTMIMAWLLGGTFPLGLKDGFHHHFGVEMLELHDFWKGFEIKNWHGDKSYDFKLMQDFKRARFVKYSAQDPDATFRLYPVLLEKLRANNLEDLYRNVELPFMEAIIEMEQNGIGFDSNGMGSVPSEVVEHLDNSYTKLASMTTFVDPKHLKKTGYAWNPNSWQQAQQVLYDLSGPYQIPPVITRAGEVTKPTDKISLSEHFNNPLVRAILTHRALIKFQSYVNGLPTWVQPHTGRVHTEIKQTGTETGRVSSKDPNMQNIPSRKRDDIDIPLNPKALRNAFVADPGNYIYAPDLSQIEMRIAAHLSNDPTMIRLITEGLDLHSNTARAIYNTTEDRVSPSEWENMRYLAKTIGFGTLYGLTAEGLLKRAPSLELELADARRFINSFYDAYPRLGEWQSEIKRFGRQTGYAITLLGRRRYLPDLTSNDRQKREEAYRAAINVPVQGSAADLFKLCVNATYQWLKANPQIRTKFVLQVHDEIVFEGPQVELPIIAEETVRIMTTIYPLRVPLKADFEYGTSWGDLTKYKKAG